MTVDGIRETPPPPPSFGTTYSTTPLHPHPHTHTIILLHGRGSTGEEFAEELFESVPSDTLLHFQQRLPTWRWVFPSSCSTYSTTFQEDMPSWFEALSLSDPSLRQEEQMPGLKEAVAYVRKIIKEEVNMLDGRKGRVFLGGISQGGAVAMWTMLHMGLEENSKGHILGGLVLASTWLPFAVDVEKAIKKSMSGPTCRSTWAKPDERDQEQRQKAEEFVEATLAASLRKYSGESVDGDRALAREAGVPIFIGHGTDDAYVDVALGRQARDILETLSSNHAVSTVQWKEYTGADQEGHWLKVPEEVNHIMDFLERHGDRM